MHFWIRTRITSVQTAFATDRSFSFLLTVALLAGLASGIYTTIFPNFLNDVYHLTAEQRGIVEFPRELPGVLIIFVIAALAALGDVRIAVIGMLICTVGMIGLGLLSPIYSLMLVWMMVYSLGQHLTLALAPNIGMSLSKREEYGQRLGRYSAFGLIATLIGYGIVWVGFRVLHMSYSAAFIIAAIFSALAALGYSRIKSPDKHLNRPRFVFRKPYILFYAQSITNGARKQVFLTFAPWVLITVYNMDPPSFAVLGVIIALLSIFTRKLVGQAIDRLGERIVLSAESVLLIVVCLGYVFAGDFLPPSIALIVIAACYILDNSMSVVEMARSTYVKKIAVFPEDVTPTLAAGIAMDHVVAMTIPAFGGMLWNATGEYKYVFVVAAFIGVLNFVLSMQMHLPKSVTDAV